jgi:hypothetical protein
MARPTRWLAAFMVWTLLVNWTWALATGNFGLLGKDTFLLFPVYYVYNTLVFLVMCVLYHRHGPRFLWLTLNALFASVLLEVASTFVLQRSFGVRGMGFFNNPNQLGFFALVCASIIAIGRRRLGFGSLKAGVGLVACLYLALVSASRASVAGIGVLFVLTIISKPRYVVAAIFVVIALAAAGGPVTEALEGTRQRMSEHRYPQYTFAQERGYDRILANKRYWLLGAGEGGTRRFAETTAFGTPEIHSSFGTVFFCYGMVGLVLFVGFLYRVAQGAPFRSQLILIPMLIYMVAHQGLRTTSVWIFLAIFVALKHMDRMRAAATQGRTNPALTAAR